MKLVEILARELNNWPTEAGDAITQSFVDTEIYSDDENERGYLGIRLESRHDEGGMPRVTRAQWEAERARIAAQEQENAELYQEEEFHTRHRKRVYELKESSKIERQKQYEQELWDKVALKTLAAQIQNPQSIAADVGWCADVADAFMAERAKRMKK